MSNYIRLTIPPGNIDQSANTILINASRTSIPANIDDSFFITPVRSTDPGTQVLYYNTTTKEVTHGISAPPTTAIWGVWGLEGSVGAAGGPPGTGHFVPVDGAGFSGNIPLLPAAMKSIAINLDDCTGPVSSLMGLAGALSASGGYHIVVRGWDLDCSGEDVYKVQAKYEIITHTIDGAAAIFDVSYNNSSGVFQGGETAPPIKYYNIVIAQDVAPMGPTGGVGVTGPTGSPAIAVSSVWAIADDPAGGGAASLPNVTEFNIANGGVNEPDPALVNQIAINIHDCNDISWNLLRDHGYLIDYYIVIRGWDSDCSGEDIYKIQTKYRITNTTYIPAPGGVAHFAVSYVSSYGIFAKPPAPGNAFYNIIIGADVAPMGPTGFTGSTGATGPTGPTGRAAIAVSSTWILDDVGGGSDPSGTEFFPVNGASIELNPSLVTEIRISSLDCYLDTAENSELLLENYLIGQKLVIRGYNDDCSGTIVEKVQAEYRITNHTVHTSSVHVPGAYMIVNYVSSAGNFGQSKYHNIIIGSDIAPIGPTGPCCTGPTGPKGPTGLPAIGAVGVWGLEDAETAPHTTVFGAAGEFQPLNVANEVTYDPSSVVQFRFNVIDCANHLHGDMNTAGLLDGAFLVVRGVDASCSGANIYDVQAKYRLLSHGVNSAAGDSTAFYNVHHIYSYGQFARSPLGLAPPTTIGYHNIIIGADIAEIGPTGPCCTGPTGYTGPKGVDGVGAAGTWENVAGFPVGGGEFKTFNAGGAQINDPSNVVKVTLNINDCYDISQVLLEADDATIGAYLVIRGWSEDCSGSEIFLVQAKYRITGHTYPVVDPDCCELDVQYELGSGFGFFGGDTTGKFHHIIVGSDPAPVGPTGPCCTGPTGPAGPAGSAAIVASSRWEADLNVGAGAVPMGDPGPGTWMAGNSAGFITTDPSSVTHFRINEKDCLGDIQSNLSTSDLSGLQIVVRGWDDDCSGNLAYNTYKVRSRHRITNAVYGTPFAEVIVDLSVNYLSGFGEYVNTKFHDIVIGADIVDPGPTGPCMWILDSSNNFYGPSGSTLLSGSAGKYNVICGPSCCITGMLDGSNNTIVGAAAGQNLTLGSSNTMIGFGAGKNFAPIGFPSGDHNIMLGATAGESFSEGSGNIFIGQLAGGGRNSRAATGTDNIFVGRGAGSGILAANSNIGIGIGAGAAAFGVGGGGNGGSKNVNIGWESGFFGVSGEGNVGIGARTLYQIDGSYNIEIGSTVDTGVIVITARNNSIILNAGGTQFDASSNAFYVNPMRQFTQSNILYYNTSTNEITYNTSEAAADLSGIWTFDSSNNFYGPSGASMNDPQGEAEKNTFGGVSVATSASFSGFNNTAFGYEAFQLGGSSEENVAIGGQALKSVETGGNNTAVGYQALSLATSSGNTAVGTTAAWQLTTGGNNTIMGADAGGDITSGGNNLLLGYRAFSRAEPDTSGCICLNATGGYFFGGATASDLSAQFFVKPIRSATAAETLYYNATTGEITYNTSAAAADVSGTWTFDSSNNFYGPSGEAGVGGFDGSGNIAIGAGAMNAAVTTGNDNVAVGTNALRDNTSGEHNVAVGREAMRDNSIGIQNTAIGHQAMMVNTTGNQNVAVGDDALVFNLFGELNTGIGWGAMAGTAIHGSRENVAVGAEALFRLEGGHNNIGIGRAALAQMRDTSSNIAIGSFAMGGYMQSGSENVAIGHNALRDVSGGFGNVALGYKAAAGDSSNFDVSGSIFIGYRAGDAPGGVASGGANIVIGYEAAGPANSDVLRGDNNILIGTRTRPGQSGESQILIGGFASGFTASAGNTIVLNATGSELESAGNDTFTVKPIRAAFVADASSLVWDPGTGEIICSTTKTFVIPYPGQEGKLLRHSCVEAPTRGTNIYEYQINVTEDNKTTTIDLPPYFKDLNSRPRVYVSPTRGFNCGGCGGYVNEALTAVIVETEKQGTFNIMVTGIRKDAGAVTYSATEMIDEPAAPKDIPPSTTTTLCSTQ